jgi:hypothetical protein
MIQESEIRRRLADALSGGADLDTFEDWLVQNSWNMHLDSSRDAQELASAIELAFAEHSSHHLSDHELRSQLLSLLDNVIALDDRQYSSSSSRSLVHELRL